MEQLSILKPIPASEFQALFDAVSCLNRELDWGAQDLTKEVRSKIRRFAPLSIRNHFVDVFEGEYQQPDFIYLECAEGLSPRLLIYAMSCLIGTPTQYGDEGGMIMDIRPIANARRNVPSYNDSLGMTLHTDLTYYDSPPDALALYCMNQGVSPAYSHFFDFAVLVESLPLGLVRKLMKPLYQFEEPVRHPDEGSGGNPENAREWAPHRSRELPIVEFLDSSKLDFFRTRYRPELAATNDPTSKSALNELQSHVSRPHFSFKLKNNELAMFSNRRYLHGRDQFDPVYDDNDRHLLRTYINR